MKKQNKKWLIDVADINSIRTQLKELQSQDKTAASGEGWSESLQQLCELKYALDETSIIVVTDVAGVITYVNEKFCQISKYSRDELIGNTHRVIRSGYHPKCFFEDMWARISSGKVWRQEICNRAKDDSIYWVDTTIIPFIDEQGKPYQYLAIRNETTDKILMRKALENLLDLSVEKGEGGSYKAICKSIQELLGVSHVLINSVSTGQGLSLAVYSKSGESEIVEYDLVGTPCERLLEQDSLSINKDLQTHFPDDEILQELNAESYVGVALKKSNGDVIGNICVMDDKVNDREALQLSIVKLFARRVESEMERQQALETEEKLRSTEDQLTVQTLFNQRLSALAAMAGGVAHELNQPLSGIRVYAQMMNKFLKDPECLKIDLAEEIMGKVIAQVDRASKIIDHMREFSAEKSNRDLQLTKVSLKEVVNSSLELIGQQLKNNRISFVNEIPAELKILANSSRLEQIFINLFSNAKDGILEKEQRSNDSIKVYAELTDQVIKLYVEDSGYGISNEVKNNLFEPFVTSKAPGSGTGLGLSICVGILKDFDSSISLESTGEYGTKFKLEFPRA
jgi:PAS domain S-box-containing protein